MTLTKLVGQNKLKTRIGSVIANSSSHAFMFSGPENIGKRTFALELAKGLLCANPTTNGGCDNCDSCRYFNAGTHPDFTAIGFKEGSKNIKVDEIRTSIIEDEIIAPHASLRKLYLINADLLNNEGQNALLKSIEEPPKNVVFLFTVTDKIKLLPTVISRCEELKVELYSESEIELAIRNKIKTSLEENNNEFEGVGEDKIKFFSIFAAGIIGNAFDLLTDKEFEELRDKVMELMFNIPSSSYTKLLYDDYRFIEENKDRIDEILLLILWFLGDLGILLKNPEATIKNMDSRNKMLSFLKNYPQFNLGRVGNCADAINEYKKNAAVNANFECSICNLLIKLNIEFK